MSKKTYSERELKFETKQLHVGQEQADPVTDAITASMQQIVSVSEMPVTFTED